MRVRATETGGGRAKRSARLGRLSDPGTQADSTGGLSVRRFQGRGWGASPLNLQRQA